MWLGIKRFTAFLVIENMDCPRIKALMNPCCNYLLQRANLTQIPCGWSPTVWDLPGEGSSSEKSQALYIYHHRCVRRRDSKTDKPQPTLRRTTFPALSAMLLVSLFFSGGSLWKQGKKVPEFVHVDETVSKGQKVGPWVPREWRGLVVCWVRRTAGSRRQRLLYEHFLRQSSKQL